MTSMERTLTAIFHKEPDRVPLFLLLSMYGAREAGVSVKRYFQDPSLVVKTQLHMKQKYANDCFYAFQYAAVEVQAMGGEVLFSEDGPPNAGEPIFQTAEDIRAFTLPDVKNTPCLANILEVIRDLKKGNDHTPIIGVVMSPVSLPVMQMGFEAYLDLLEEQPEVFLTLVNKNQQFCAQWANAQLEAGATAICYFDPLSSTTMMPAERYQTWGARFSRETLSMIGGPTATHMASGRCLGILNDIIGTGTQVLGISANDDLAEMKDLCKNRIALLGNLDGIGMCGWSPERAFYEARFAIQSAAAGGGFILSDNHGEIPLQVDEDVLMAISDAVRECGQYPIKSTVE